MANNEILYGLDERELHSRTADGILVQLMWASKTNSVFVHVSDNKTGESFRVPVPEGERPLHVFTHPYAFANSIGEQAVEAAVQN